MGSRKLLWPGGPPPAARPARPKRGFTLVELLVVIAILALLVTILMPSLTRAGELARRSVCMSNLHVLNTDMLAYAAIYQGRVPVSYQTYCKQFNYGVFQKPSSGQTSKPLGGYGAMHMVGCLDNGPKYYCPSMKHEMFTYNSARNPWPFPGTAPTRTRLGYGSRPSVCWQAQAWASAPPAGIPRLRDMTGDTAITADIISNPGTVEACHVDGTSVGYLDASAAWKDRSVLGDAWEEMHFDYLTSDNPVMLNDNVAPPQGVWTHLDRK